MLFAFILQTKARIEKVVSKIFGPCLECHSDKHRGPLTVAEVFGGADSIFSDLWDEVIRSLSCRVGAVA